MDFIPALPGSYALHLINPVPRQMKIGRLDEFTFPSGHYLYMGSAHGPGGLKARLRHHARVSSRPHWHLDYLRPFLHVAGGWYATGTERLECEWVSLAAREAGAGFPAKGFGSADCINGCTAHLVAFAGLADFSRAAQLFDNIAIGFKIG